MFCRAPLVLLGSLVIVGETAVAPPAARVHHLPKHKHGLAARHTASSRQHHGVSENAAGGLQCYTSEGFAVGDLSDCDQKQARCFMRWHVNADGTVNEMKRYCTSAESCPTNAFEEYQSHGKTYTSKCCDSSGCNGGIPARIEPGLYWLRPADDDNMFVTRSADGSLDLAEFANDETQKFQVRTLGASLEATYALLPPGTETDGAQAWTILEVAEGEFEVKANAGGAMQSIVGAPDAKFTLTRTPTWEVAYFGKKCPESVKVGGVANVEECQQACQADSGCVDVIEWDASKSECFKVMGSCDADSTASGGDDYYSFKAKCALVHCHASDSCHAAGTCNAQTGTCSNPMLADSTPCNDGNALTVEDQCKAGVCSGVDKCAGKSCPAENDCYEEGTCDKHTGKCVAVMKAGGTSCDDGNSKTVDDVCNAGVCAGRDLCKDVNCDAPSTCHLSGRCDQKTGRCSIKTKKAGASCDDGSKLTDNDTCDENAVCQGEGKCDKVKCVAKGPCFTKGECNAETGKCSNPPKDQGAECDDLSDVTVDDVCDGHGVCAGVDKCEGVTCESSEPCKDAGMCDHASGQCLEVVKQDGAHCDDGDDVTVMDVCVAGECKGSKLCENVECEALDDCHEAGECDPQTGDCSTPLKPDDEPCDDGKPFTQDDKCLAGVCNGTATATGSQGSFLKVSSKYFMSLH